MQTRILLNPSNIDHCRGDVIATKALSWGTATLSILSQKHQLHIHHVTPTYHQTTICIQATHYLAVTLDSTSDLLCSSGTRSSHTQRTQTSLYKYTVQHNQTTNEHHLYWRLTKSAKTSHKHCCRSKETKDGHTWILIITRRTIAYAIPRKDLEDNTWTRSAHPQLTTLQRA